MSKKKIIIPIVILLLIAAAVTFVILLPNQTNWIGTYICYNLEGLYSELNNSDHASSVLEHTEIECNFTVTLNPISYRGEGTVIYNGNKYSLSYVNITDPDPNRPILLLESENGNFSKQIIMSKDTECFIINENFQGWWIVFSGNDPTIEEIRSRISELGFVHF